MIALSFPDGPFRTVQRPNTNGTSTMLWTILVILVALWLLGLIASVGGAFIHLLLVVALIVLVAQFMTGRRSV